MSCTSESGSVFKGNDISVGFLDHGVFQSYVFKNRVGGGWWLNRGNYGISSLTGTSWFI